MQIFLFIALFIAAVAILFALQNNATTTINFAIWHFQSSLALLLLIALAVGAIISVLFSLPSNIKARWTIRQQRKKMTELETSLNSLNTQNADLKTQLDGAQKKPMEPAAEATASLPAGKAALPEPSGSDKKPAP
jgi:lipopolysaccharide assembly protein A